MDYVLIIDNDQMLRSVLVQELQRVGVTTKEANDGQDGLARAKEEHPKVIILDEHMPNMNGQQFMDALKKEDWFKEVHIVVFTALHDVDLMNHKMIAGVSDYMDKAVSSPTDVVQTVLKYIQPKVAPQGS